MNLFLLLGQLGMSWDHSGQPLIPIGTVYDPFVCRGLDALIYATYSGARFIVAETPSGVSLAPEGGAHQSSITASIGLELPGITAIEPAFVSALDWLMCDAVRRIADGPAVDEGAYDFRLTTRPIDQAPFDRAKARLGSAVLRRQVLSGAYLLHDASPAVEGDPAHAEPQVLLVASGAVMPEVLAASAELAEEGILASVVDVTSGDRLYAAWQRTIRQGI
jgi:pyruvate dehydrogenase E1 component